MRRVISASSIQGLPSNVKGPGRGEKPTAGREFKARASVADDRRAAFAVQDINESATLQDRKHHHRDMVVAGNRDGGGIHDGQALGKYLGVSDVVVARRGL